MTDPHPCWHTHQSAQNEIMREAIEYFLSVYKTISWDQDMPIEFHNAVISLEDSTEWVKG